MLNRIKSQNLFLTFAIFLVFLLTACSQNEAPKSSTISMKAGLVYKMGGVQPVARVKFYLLKKDLQALQKESSASNTKNSVYVTPFSAKMSQNGIRPVQAGLQEEELKDYIVATTTTDFEGNAKFDNVPPGTYYLSGLTPTKGDYGYVVWSLKVDTETTKETVLLDQNNAFEVEKL